MWPGTPRDMRLVRAYCRGRDICEGAGAVWDAAGSGMSGTARTLPPCACSRTSIFPPAGRPGSWGFCGRLRVRLLLGEVRVGVGVVGAAGGGGELEVAGPGGGGGPRRGVLCLGGGVGGRWRGGGGVRVQPGSCLIWWWVRPQPVCRHDHRTKQAPGWTLTQPRPGHMTWTTPSGSTYTTGPTSYPD